MDSQGKKIDTLLSELTNDVLSMADEKAKQNAAEDTYIRIIKNTPQVILEHVNGSPDAIIRLENGRLNVISDLGGKNGLKIQSKKL